jgi:hypothetical protein
LIPAQLKTLSLGLVEAIGWASRPPQLDRSTALASKAATADREPRK